MTRLLPLIQINDCYANTNKLQEYSKINIYTECTHTDQISATTAAAKRPIFGSGL